MTSQEMLQAWIKGKTYQEIGDICGISRQAVYLRIKTLSKGKMSKIVYKGVYDYFANNDNMNFSKFASQVNDNGQIIEYGSLKRFLCGEITRVPLSVIMKICEIISKPIEEVFKRRIVQTDT